MTDSPDLGALYRLVRLRICGLLPEIDTTRSVAACPGWMVRDVIAHLVGVVEDVTSGRMTGPPKPATTAEQVTRRRHSAVPEMVEDWSRIAPEFERMVSAACVWPAFLDVLSHEHDIRGAVSHPANRETEEMVIASQYLIRHLELTQPVTVRLGHSHIRIGGDQESDLTLSVSDFEAFRFRMGRRSFRQLTAMDWTGDPTPILPELTIFGPAGEDVVE